jgi:hypothetical protein
MNENRPDPIPEEFESYDEAGKFWDSHDTTDYPDTFHTVKVVSELKGRHFEIEIEEDLIQKLQSQAKTKGINVGSLANQLLRQQLVTSE